MRKRMLTLMLVLALAGQSLTALASEQGAELADETKVQMEYDSEKTEEAETIDEEIPEEGVAPDLEQVEQEILPEAFPEADEEPEDELQEKAGGYSLQLAPTPSQTQINDFVRNHPFSFSIWTDDTWKEQPSISLTAPRAGRLSDTSLESGLNCMNSLRYAAGVPSDVVLDESYIAKAQAGTTLLAAMNKGLDHRPEQPVGTPKDFYDEAYAGTRNSNLGRGHHNIAHSILSCMDDDGSNEQTVGHRRWLLDSTLAKTGFGSANRYYASYVIDGSRASTRQIIAWPAANTPVEFIECKTNQLPWSITLGTRRQYQDTQATLTLTNLRTGTSATIHTTGNVKTGLRLDPVGSGDGETLIFVPAYTMPNVVKDINAGDQYHVEVTGIKDSSGQECELQYDVNFFSLDKDVKDIIDKSEDEDDWDDDWDDNWNDGWDDEWYDELDIESPVTMLAAGKSVKINSTGKVSSWSVSNKKYASISSSGKLTAKKAGAGKTVTVTAKNAYNRVSIKIKIMKGAVKSVKLTGAKSLKAGRSMKIKAKVKTTAKPANTGLKWSVNNSTYAKISSSGKLTAKAAGKGKTVTVTAKSTDGTNKKAKFKVKIK